MRRREFISIIGGAVAWPQFAFSQTAQRAARVGWLAFGGSVLGPIEKTLVEALAQRGLVDGQTIEIVFRYADNAPNRLALLAQELVQLKPNVLIAIGGDITMAFVDASREIPIVGGVSDNPIRAGFTSSYSRPDKNFTGVSYITDEMAAKRMELLKEISPLSRRVGVLWNPQHLDDEMTFARRAAQSLDIELFSYEASDTAALEKALVTAAANNIDSLFVIPSRLTSANAIQIGAFGRERRLPVVTAWREFVDAGCLLSYGPSRRHESKTLALYVERILRGAKPADLPIQLPSKFEMVLNMKAAQAIGITVSGSTLLRADEVVE
jgi:putative tryptophan/tyrosine transport system substrate-binding protein